MAPHELGHFFRANEVNATFWIEGLGFPGPVGHIVFPATKTKEDELAFVTGGIEVNTLYAMNVQKDWYRYNGLFNDEIFEHFFIELFFLLMLFLSIQQYLLTGVMQMAMILLLEMLLA